MPSDISEKAFEAAIEHHLTTVGGYLTGDRNGFDPHRLIFPAVTSKIDLRGEVA